MLKQKKINIAVGAFLVILLIAIFANFRNEQKFVDKYEKLYLKQLETQEKQIEENQIKLDSISSANKELERLIQKTNKRIDKEFSRELTKIEKKYEKDSITVSNYSTDKSIEFLSDYLSSKTK